MNFDHIPQRPNSERYQKFIMIASGLFIFLVPGFFMYLGVGSVFEEGTFLYNLATGAAAIFCAILAVKTVESMEKKHKEQVYAWDDYWCAYWQRVNELEDQLADLPADAPEYEVQRVESDLSYMRGIEKRADLLYPDRRSSAKSDLVSSSSSFDYGKYKDNLRKNLPRDIFVFLIVIVASVFLVGYVILPKLDLPDFHFGSSNAKPAPTLSTSSQSSILQYYQHNYPQTWGYISKYADDPFNYLQYYHSVWGRLQVYHGDGIPFGTLTAFEQRLVSYPPIKSYIYLATGQTTYHSTPDCYTLLRSDVYAEPSKYFSLYDPCSKCVGE